MELQGISALPRVALYALLTAIEEDVRLVLTRHLDGLAPNVVIGEDLAQRAQERGLRDLGEEPKTLPELLVYIDFGDAWQLVNRHADALPPDWAAIAKRHARTIEQLNGVRNRVMHSRPLDFDDLPMTMEFVATLERRNTLSVPRLRE